MQNKKKFIIIDGHHLIFRAYYAINGLTKSDGTPVNAIFGVASMLLNIIEKEGPDYFAFTFDLFKSFRHDKASDYKAHRKETPEDLKSQLEPIYKMVEDMGLNIYALDGFEADDIMGTLAERQKHDKDTITYLVTGDMDAMQLVSDGNTLVAYPNKGYREPIYYDQQAVIEKYGLKPSQVAEYKALAGDSSDNIKGVEGIGEIGAKKLIGEYGSLDGIYKNIENIRGNLRHKLIEGKSSAYFSLEMTTIRTDAPISFDIKDCEFKGLSHLTKQLFEFYEFRSLVSRLEKLEKRVDTKNQMTLF